jgi:hypothetical protein
MGHPREHRTPTIHQTRSAILILLAGIILLAGCAGQGGDASVSLAAATQDPMAQAAAEATALVLKARMTALVMQAQAEATALIEEAQRPPEILATPSPLAGDPTRQTNPPTTAAGPTETPGGVPALEGTPTDIVLIPSPIASQGDWDLLAVGYAADGGFIMISFTAPVDQVALLYQGTVSVTNEGTGEIYNEIPVMPVVGPMVGRPIMDGQPGYVMLVNHYPPLQPGSLVTIVLGEIRFEHIPIKW